MPNAGKFNSDVMLVVRVDLVEQVDSEGSVDSVEQDSAGPCQPLSPWPCSEIVAFLET